MEFKDLHSQNDPLLIGNVWDVPSTKTAERLHFRAIATSSSAIAGLLGYQDGEEMSFSELEFVVKRILSNTQLPVSVDLEAGYSRNSLQIVDHIRRLADLGVVGINIEDSIVDRKRTLQDANIFSETLSTVNNLLEKEGVDIFLNVRTDTFLLGHPNVIEETKKRIALYEDAGADGIFTPCIEKITDIESIVACTKLPLNVLCMPGLPDFDRLKQAGVQRISMGNFLFDAMYSQFEQIVQTVLKQGSFQSIF